MRVGIQIVGTRSSEMVPLARAAEAAGLDSVFFPTGGFYIGAMRVIDATERIRVGTGIIPMFHGTPYLHASTALALQEMSGGRFVLGLGSQTKGQVRRMAGVDLDRPAARARDMIRAIRGLMTEGRYDGEYYTADPPGGFSLRSRHREVPPPPIHFSGLNRLNLRVAGEVSDGLIGHPIFSARWMDEVVLPEVQRGLDRGARSRADFELAAMPMVWVVDGSATREEGYRRAKRNLANYYSTRAYGGFLELHGWARERDAIRAVWEGAQASREPIDGREMEALVSDEMADEVCLIGTPAELRDIARERFHDRADTLLLYPLHDSYATPDERESRIRESEENLYRAIDAFVPITS